MSICSTSPKFDGPLVVSPRVAMLMLDCSRATFYGLVKRKEVETYAEGASRKVVVASIHALIQRRVAAASAKFTPARSPRKRQAKIAAAAATDNQER
jgi:hypothetical protein